MWRKVVVTYHALFLSLDQHTFRSFLFGCAALVWQHEKQSSLTVVLKQQVHLVYPASSNTRDTVFPHVEDTFFALWGHTICGTPSSKATLQQMGCKPVVLKRAMHIPHEQCLSRQCQVLPCWPKSTMHKTCNFTSCHYHLTKPASWNQRSTAHCFSVRQVCLWDFTAELCSVKLRLTAIITVQRAAAVTSLRLTCHLVYSPLRPWCPQAAALHGCNCTSHKG